MSLRPKKTSRKKTKNIEPSRTAHGACSHRYEDVDIYKYRCKRMNANNTDWEKKYIELEAAQISKDASEDDREWIMNDVQKNIALWREDAKKYGLTTVVCKEMTPAALRFAEENTDAVYLHTVLDAQSSVLHDVFWTVRGLLQVQAIIGDDYE